MRPYQQKMRKYRQQIRMQHREQIKNQNRPWGELPSAIIELPSRIENNDWEGFEQLLESFTTQDLAVIDQGFKVYMHNAYHSHFAKIQIAGYIHPSTLNLFRLMLRLRIADNSQFRDGLKILQYSYQLHLSDPGRSQPLQVIFKILKQFVLFIQQNTSTGPSADPSLIINEYNLHQMNRIICKMTLYKTYNPIKIECQNKQTFNQYRVYYILLLSCDCIDFRDYIKQGNVEELFYLVHDSIKNKQYYEVAAQINCMQKLVRLASSIQGYCIYKALQILLIDGLQAAQMYCKFQKGSINCNQYSFQFKGKFFEQLLMMLSVCDVDTIVKGIQLLGQLFLTSDNYIQAITKTINKNALSNQQVNQNSKNNLVCIGSEQFKTYQQLFLFYMTHICTNVRMKTYWMLSNIVGSQRFFYTYGVIFIKQVYQKDLLYIQKDYVKIHEEILICILNYMCNLQVDSRSLHALTHKQQSQNQAKDFNKERKRYNCFIFCLQTIINTLEQIFHSQNFKASEVHIPSPKQLTFLSRSAYALFILLVLTKYQRMYQQYQLAIYQLGKAQLIPHFQQFLFTQINDSEQMKSVYSSIEQILKHLQLSKQNL